MKIINFPVKQFLILLSVYLLSQGLQAQSKSLLDSISLYGSIITQVAIYKDKAEIQNNGTKVGFGTAKSVNGDLHFFANVELSVNLVENNYTFNTSINTSENIPDAIFSEDKDAVSTRLGYLGLSFKNWGTLTFGKQLGAYYDVSGWTDMFNVFGGQASSTYLTGTDGGETGTGRAAKAIVYRNQVGPFKITAQAQLNGVRTNYAGALRYAIGPHLELGIGVNSSRIAKTVMDIIRNVDENEITSIFGIKFYNEKIYTAFNFNLHGGNVIPLEVNDSIIMYGYNCNGYEWFFKYLFNKKFTAYGGINVQIPKENDSFMPNDFHLEYYVIGVDYNIAHNIQTYCEMKFDNSVNAIGHHCFNVYCLGLKIDLGLHKKFIDPG